MESLKIVLISVGAAVLYGVIHDQFTARICVEYFTLFHAPVFATQSPTLLGSGWGIIATWWVGAFLGVLLAVAARAGSRPKLSPGILINPIGKLLLIMAGSALISGLAGYILARNGVISPPEWIAFSLRPSAQARFIADWWAHSASYGVGLLGGIVLCVRQYQKAHQEGLKQPRHSSWATERAASSDAAWQPAGSHSYLEFFASISDTV